VHAAAHLHHPIADVADSHRHAYIFASETEAMDYELGGVQVIAALEAVGGQVANPTGDSAEGLLWSAAVI
jgi:hypothetical protein